MNSYKLENYIEERKQKEKQVEEVEESHGSSSSYESNDELSDAPSNPMVNR